MRHCLVVGTLLLAVIIQLAPASAFAAASFSQKSCVRKVQPQTLLAAVVAPEQGEVTAIAAVSTAVTPEQQAAMPRTGYEVVQSFEVPDAPPALSDAVKRGENAEFPMPIAMWLHGACTEQFPSISAARKAVRRLEIVLNGKDATTVDRVKPGIASLHSFTIEYHVHKRSHVYVHHKHVAMISFLYECSCKYYIYSIIYITYIYIYTIYGTCSLKCVLRLYHCIANTTL
jgi:hypothetical protein